MRLIDANELKEYTSFLKSRCIPNSEPYKMYESLERMIDKSPVIDAEPVKHGHWIFTEYAQYCSHCGANIDPDDNADAFRFRYCPYCRARMDGDE